MLEATTSVPFAISGTFIQSFERGQLQTLSAYTSQFSRLTARKHKLEQELANCNDPKWLARFAARLTGGNFKQELVRRANRLEAGRAELLPEWEALRQKLEQETPGVAAAIESSPPSEPRFGLDLDRRKRPRHRDVVAERNKVIQKYRHLHHLQICRELDDAFPPGANAAAQQMPSRWKRDFGVTTFEAAYFDPRCQPRVHRLISGAKH